MLFYSTQKHNTQLPSNVNNVKLIQVIFILTFIYLLQFSLSHNLEKDMPATRDKTLAFSKNQEGWSLLAETPAGD